MANQIVRSGTTRHYRYNTRVEEKRSHLRGALVATFFIVVLLSATSGAYLLFGKTLRARVQVLQDAVPGAISPTALAYDSNNSPKRTEIERTIYAAMDKNKAKLWSVSVYDLGADHWLADINGDSQISSASLYKLYVAYGLSKKMHYNRWANEEMGGKKVSSCVDMMIRMSDNDCGILLGKHVGWATIDSALANKGYRSTFLNRSDHFVTSSHDTTQFMRDMFYGKLFDEQATEFVMSSLEKQTHRSGIPAGCTDCKVWNKTGENSGITHDTAIVKSGQRTYAVTIMSKGGSMEKIANMQRVIEKAIQ